MTTNGTALLKKLLILFLVFAGLHFAKGFLVPLCIGGVLATLFLPFCNWMERKKVRKGIAALICLLTLMLVITGIGFLFGWQISELNDDAAIIKERASEVTTRIQEFLFNNFGISEKTQQEILMGQQSAVNTMMRSVAGSAATILTSFILIHAYVFLLLYYRNHIRKFLLKLASQEQRSEMSQVIHGVAHVSQEYLLGLTKMIVCLWIMYGIGFSALGVENAIFFAILCGLLEIVPYIGNITGTAITLLVAAVHGASPTLLFGIVLTYSAVQFIQGWFLEPLILGPQVKINPLFTILALVVGQLVWGIAGIFLAIPVIAMLKIVCDHIVVLKPYGFLIGEIDSSRKKAPLIKRIRMLFNR